MSSRFLEGLNDRQAEAVTHTEGPLLVLAGAGSGKTKVLTHRAGYLVEQGVEPGHILAITFTNKAAGEMKERIARVLGERARAVWVSTFHALSVRILRRDIERLSLPRDFVIYDAPDQRTLIRNIIKKLGLDPRVYRERAVASMISSAKNRAMDYASVRDSFYDANVKRIFDEYTLECGLSGALDFDDLLLRTLELFGRFPDVLAAWQDRFHYIMVDEYQDTNNVQFEIVRLLAEGHGNLCVVGDDDQSIYRFRGANIENILSFERSFPGARVVKLEQNYRSTGSVLGAANAVIGHNPSRKAKTLWTDNEPGALPVYREYETAQLEAAGIVESVMRRRREGVSLSSQAVLYRTNAQSRLLEERCVALSLPYTVVGGVNFYQRKEIKDIISYLRLVANPDDDLSLNRVINTPRRGIGAVTIEKIAAYASHEGVSMYKAALSGVPGLGRVAAEKVRGFCEYIGRLRAGVEGADMGPGDIIRDILSEGGYEEELSREDPVEAETRRQNIEELVDKAVSYGEEHEELRGMGLMSLFLEEVSLIADIDRTDPDAEALTLMTLHAAKGLEFDEVYLSGMEEGLFPSGASLGASDPEAEIEEERRLCYVGITRARKKLYLSSASQRMRMGELSFMKHSRFIDEIPDSCMEKHFLRKRGLYESAHVFGGAGHKASARPAPLSARGLAPFSQTFTKTRPDYVPGDRVSHVKFGPGTVADVSEEERDYRVTVDFDEAGRRVMYAGFAKMGKL